MKQHLSITIFLLFWFLTDGIQEVTSVKSINKYRSKRYPPIFHGIKHHYHRIPSRKPKYVLALPESYHPVKTPSPSLNHFVHYCGSIEHILPNYQHHSIKELQPHFTQDEFEVETSSLGLNEDIQVETNFGHSFTQHQEHFVNYPKKTLNSFKNGANGKKPLQIHQPTNIYDFVEVPYSHNPPLDYAPKSSYDTPGAVTSYGTPVVKQELPLQSNDELDDKSKIENYFQIEIHLDDGGEGASNYNKYNRHHQQVRQLDLASSSSAVEVNKFASPSLPNSESNTTDGVAQHLKHPNHRYNSEIV